MLKELWKKIEKYLDKHWETTAGHQRAFMSSEDSEENAKGFVSFTIGRPKPDIDLEDFL